MKWWLSFAEEPNRFLGVIITEAPDFIGAVMRTHTLGINPGGEVMGWQCVPGSDEVAGAPVDRLLSKQDLSLYFDDCKTVRELEEAEERP